MLTAEQLVSAGIFPEADAQDCLWVESGLAWLKVHTTLPTLPLEELPAGAKLFLQQYSDVMQRGGVISESIEGLSQSFGTASQDSLLMELAKNLLPEYFTAFRFMPKQQYWAYSGKEGHLS